MTQKPNKKSSKKEKKVPPVIQAVDQPVLVATADYPYANWKFEKFNPVQSRVFDFYDKDTNGLIAAMTSAGKTTVAEMFLAQEIRERGGKGMFLAPLRALAREKINDWTDKKYHFADQKISICTGDYRLTKDRAKELSEANLIVMTSEMLNHRSRNYKSEQNNWLTQVGTLVIDESHLLTVPGRGDHLEVGLMKFTEINPKARLVLLSATMPNVEEIADWVSYSLTKRNTFMLKSKYRPVPLTVHYESFPDDGGYDEQEQEKVNRALEIVEWYPDDKFLVFAHTKRTGELMKQNLKKAGIDAQFHNADLSSDERAKVEDQFKNDPKLRVIVATSTLAWGLNLPARRVIILGVTRGINEVESHDILQMVGRSGRAGIDPMGDAYILVPESNETKYRQKYSKPGRIESQLLQFTGEPGRERYKILAFHLVSEIHHGNIKTTDDVHDWFKRSLAYFQNKSLEEEVIESTLSSLKKCSAIWEENGTWTCRPIGKVSSMFYFSPFDVSNLYFNFKNLFDDNKQDNDYYLSMALADLDSQRTNIVSRLEKDEMANFVEKIRFLMGGKFKDPVLKAGFCYYSLLNGVTTQACGTPQKMLKSDFNRLSQVLQSLDTFTGQFGRSTYFKTLEGRIMNGVPAHLVDLCKLDNIGKTRATKLYNAGFKTVEDISSMDFEKFKSLVNLKKESAQEIMNQAKKMVF